MTTTQQPPTTVDEQVLPASIAAALGGAGGPAQPGRFPRAIIERLGEHGVLRRRWAGSHPGDVAYGMRLSREVARQATLGIAVGVGVHTESVLALLGRFAGASGYLRQLRESALDGTAIGCLAVSEPTGGSDLSAMRTLAVPVADGWRITGTKKYVSLGATADFMIVLCQVADAAGRPSGRLATVVVPRAQTALIREHVKVGTQDLDTAAVELVDAVVPADAMLGRPGMGLVAINYGLSFERLAVASHVLGACGISLELVVEHAGRRTQFGKKLRAHQHLEFRMAEAWAELALLDGAVEHLARQVQGGPLNRQLMARIAAVKMHAARLGERIMSECMQLFGGPGYLTEETPVGRTWLDIRLARMGGGTDEMMLAIIASELRGNPEAYEQRVRISG